VIEEDVVRVGEHGHRIRVWAIRQDALFDRAGLYQEKGIDYADNLDRFVFFCRAVIEGMAYLKAQYSWKPDILHLNDWQTALCAVYLKTIDRERVDVQGARTLLTLHNVGYQGIFPRADFARTGLALALFTPSTLEFHGSVNLLKGGIVFADHLTTVSPTYAREILTPEFGFGLDGVLRGRKHRLTGILNGIDIEAWNPETDAYLPAHYSVTNWAGKATCKRSLQREFRLPEKDVPLVSVIARLASQKGSDLIDEIIPDLMILEVQLVVLGTGDPAYEKLFRSLAERYAGKFLAKIAYDDRLAHQIEAGADIFLMPSRYEPCGLNQIYSMKYATVPVVRATGGLDDTVENFDGRQGTGFKFTEYSPSALLSTLRKALTTYQQRPQWQRLVQNCMKQDFSWSNSARQYAKIYRALAESKKQTGLERGRSERSITPEAAQDGRQSHLGVQ